MGARIVFRQTASQTNGELLQFDFFLQPRHVIALEHLHPRQEERFQVISGTVRGRMEGKDQQATQGQLVVTPPGMPHVWWNEGPEEAHLLVEFRPALQTENFLAGVFALARRGQADKHGLPGLLQLALLAETFPDTMYPSSPPFRC
jgi:quercetin dioxygenase-like cupin family protein